MNQSQIADIATALEIFDSLHSEYEVSVEEATVVVEGGKKVVIGFDDKQGQHIFILVKKP